MSIRTKIDFSGITSDHIVTSDNKKYIHEDDEIFNSLKDEIAACENAQVQTELATLQILEIKEETKVIANEAIDTATERAETAAENAEEIREEIRVIANEAIDTATERAETAAENAENAQALAETAAINALEAERNVTEFSETFAKLDEDNTFTGNNNFTGTLTINDKEVLTSSNFDDFVKLDEDNTFSGTNNFTGALTVNNKSVLTSSDSTVFAKTNANNTFSGTNNFTGTLQSKGNTVLTTSDASNYFKLNAANTITSNILVKDTTKYINFGYEYNSSTGAVLALHSINHDTESARGAFSLFARDANNNYLLQGRAYDGALLWKGKHVITQDTPYNLFFDQTSGTYKYLGYNHDSNKTVSGSYLKFNNANDTSAPGFLTIAARNLEKQATLGLSPDGTLTWTGSDATIGGQSVVRKVVSTQATTSWHTHITSGLLIQSGEYMFTKGNSTGDVITLPKPFNNAYYTVLVILDGDTTNDGNGMLSVVSKTTTSFKIHNGQAKTGMYRWIAIGFNWDFS